MDVTAIKRMVRLDLGTPIARTPGQAHLLTTQLVAVLADLAEPASRPNAPEPGARRPHLVLVAG